MEKTWMWGLVVFPLLGVLPKVTAQYCPDGLYLDVSLDPAACKPCTVCRADEYELAPCTSTRDSVCSYCPAGQWMNDLEAFCRPCHKCCKGSRYVLEPSCVAARGADWGCMVDEGCEEGSDEIPKYEKKFDLGIFPGLLLVLGILTGILVGVVFVALGRLCFKRMKLYKDTRPQFPEGFMRSQSSKEENYPEFLDEPGTCLEDANVIEFHARHERLLLRGQHLYETITEKEVALPQENGDDDEAWYPLISGAPSRCDIRHQVDQMVHLSAPEMHRTDQIDQGHRALNVDDENFSHALIKPECLSTSDDEDVEELIGRSLVFRSHNFPRIDLKKKPPQTYTLEPIGEGHVRTNVDDETYAQALIKPERFGRSVEPKVTVVNEGLQTHPEEPTIRSSDQSHEIEVKGINTSAKGGFCQKGEPLVEHNPEADDGNGNDEQNGGNGSNDNTSGGDVEGISGSDGRTSGNGESGGDEGTRRNSDDAEDEGGEDDNYNYVDFYKKITATLKRCGVTFVGHLGAGKTALKDALIGNPFEETGSTNGVELTTCSVSKTQLDACHTAWKEAGKESGSYHEDLDRMVADLILPNVDDGQENKPSLHIEDHTFERDFSEMTLWDMSGEFAFYKTHQMFLFPSNVFLVVMDITKGLDEPLPQSCATRAQTGKIECPRTPREFLDYWLNTICTFSTKQLLDSAEDDEDVSPHVIIVTTHTDELEADRKEERIQDYKKEVLKHVKSQYACRFVHNKVYDVSNKQRNDEEFNSLRAAILKLCQAKPTYGIQRSCSWLKCEDEMKKMIEVQEKRVLPLEMFRQIITTPLSMNDEQVQDFLSFHCSYGNILVDEDSQVIYPNLQYLVDAFKAVITMWQFRDISNLNLTRQRVVEEELEYGILSKNTLKILWHQHTSEPDEIETLAAIMTRFGHFIQDESGTKHIVPALLPPCKATHLDPIGSFHEVEGAKPLMYLFYNSNNANEAQCSAFLPSGLFPQLVASMMEAGNKAFKNLKIFFNAATFRAGSQNEYVVSISCHKSAIMFRAFAVGGEYDIPNLRIQFEAAIQAVLVKKFQNLQCSTCICPCDFTSSSLQLNCLQILGPIGEVGKKPLPEAACLNPNCDQKKHSPIRSYERWFCDNPQEIITDVMLNNVAKLASTWEKVYDIGTTLRVPHDTIETKRADNNYVFLTALHTLHYWNNDNMDNPSKRYQIFQQAVRKVFCKNLEELTQIV